MKQHDFATKWVMVVDLDKCTGCGACMVACQVENNTAPINPYENYDASNKLRTLTWMLVYEALNNGKSFPDYEVAYLPRPCMQCGNPSCVPVCPVIATDKNEDGRNRQPDLPPVHRLPVLHGRLPLPCPVLQLVRPGLARGHGQDSDPERVSPAPGRGREVHLLPPPLMNAKERARQEGVDPLDMPQEWYQPACVEVCPTGAITFGDLKNPKHEVHELAKSPKYAFRIAGAPGDRPPGLLHERPGVGAPPG